MGAIVLLLTAITATVGLVNAVLAGISRLLHGMALNGQAFGFLAWRHARYDSPWAAIVAISVAFAIPILLMGNTPETIMNLVIAASTSWLVAYIVAHINLIVLRRRYPQAPRPFRSPLFPLPQIVGIGGMVYVISCSPDEVMVIAGYVLGVVGVASALWTRFVMKRGLFAPEPLPALSESES
jgi:amino acid transporter